MVQEPQKIEITQQLAQAILDYLAEKPYKETFQLVAGLQSQAKESLGEAEETHDHADENAEDEE